MMEEETGRRRHGFTLAILSSNLKVTDFLVGREARYAGVFVTQRSPFPSGYIRWLRSDEHAVNCLYRRIVPSALQRRSQPLRTELPDADRPRVVVRVNAFGTPWDADDVLMVRASPIRNVMVPKAEGPGPLGDIGTRCGNR
jgi:hypothetical protein